MPSSDPTDVPRGVSEDAVDELYGLPIDDFTPRRDALARELRDAGKRDASTWVKSLRKPTAAAWIANQLARSRPREAKELLRAGDKLRSAQERLLAGKADPDDLRSASDAEHTAAQALLANADGFLDQAGKAPSASTLEKVAQTIRVVALDDEARAGFECGRLTRERAASGFGPLAGTGAPAPARKKRTPKRDARPTRDAATRKARETLKKAQAAQRGQARALKTAEKELATAEREAARAAKRLEAARADVTKTRSSMAELESRIAAAERELEPG